MAITTKKKSGRTRAKRTRASVDEIVNRKARMLAVVKRRRAWFGRREVAKQLKSDPNPSRTLTLLVADGHLKKRGERRARQYLVRG